MAYVLATTENVVRWYAVTGGAPPQPGDFELLDRLDLTRVQQYGDIETAKGVALALGLKSWRYVQIKT